MDALRYRCFIVAAALAAGAPSWAAAPVLGIGSGTEGQPATAPAIEEPLIGIQEGLLPGKGPAMSTVTLASPSAGTAKAKWEVGDPAADMLNAISGRFGVILVMPKFSAVVLRAGELPKTLDEAISEARDNLEPQGWGIVQNVTGKPNPRVILRIEPLKVAQDAQNQSGPVTSGSDAGVIDIKRADQPVTHLMTVNHPEMIDRLQRKATEDADVSADVVGSARGGYTLILRGPAVKVKKALSAVATLDAATDDQPTVKSLKLTNLDAEATAASLNAEFAQEGKGQMRAVADRRTNTLIVTGPEDQVIDTMVTLIGMDLGGKGSDESGAGGGGPPATSPAGGPARGSSGP